MKDSGITLSKFYNFLAKIEKAYNRKYPEAQTPLFYEKLRGFPEEVFNQSVDDLCVRHKTLPGFNEIEEKLVMVFRSIRKDIRYEPLRFAAAPKCWSCFDRGLLEAVFIADETQTRSASVWIFKCTCKAGVDRIEDYPVWGMQHTKDFFLVESSNPEIKAIRERLKAEGVPKKDLFNRIYTEVMADAEQERKLRWRTAYYENEKNHVRPIAVIHAMLEIEDVSRVPFKVVVELARNLDIFQEALITGAHGKDALRDHDNEQLIVSLIVFCKKFEIKNTFHPGELHG